MLATGRVRSLENLSHQKSPPEGSRSRIRFLRLEGCKGCSTYFGMYLRSVSSRSANAFTYIIERRQKGHQSWLRTLTIPRICLRQGVRERSASDLDPMLSVYTIISGYAASTKRTSLFPFSSHTIGSLNSPNRWPVVGRI
jgi:hypothetical protein